MLLIVVKFITIINLQTGKGLSTTLLEGRLSSPSVPDCSPQIQYSGEVRYLPNYDNVCLESSHPKERTGKVKDGIHLGRKMKGDLVKWSKTHVSKKITYEHVLRYCKIVYMSL